MTAVNSQDWDQTISSMESEQQMIADLRAAWLECILKELRAGLECVQVASYSKLHGRQEDFQRQKTIAREAVFNVLQSLPAAKPTPEQRVFIESQLAKLESSLKSL